MTKADFALGLRAAKDGWELQNRNFGSAYSTAFRKYNDTLEKQKDADKEAAEATATMVMLALSLAGGSVLTAVFGEEALGKVLAKRVQDAALNAVVKYGCVQAFNALAWTVSDKTARFVIGKLWEEGGKQVKDKFEAGLKEAKKFAEVPESQGEPLDPLQYQNNLQNYTSGSDLVLARIAQSLPNGASTEATLGAIASGSPYFKGPKSVFFPGAAERIELVLWMRYVLGQDAVQRGEYQEVYGALHGMKAVVTSTEPIKASPLSRDFPSWQSTGGSFQRVVYQPVGDIIKKRVDAVYGAAFHGQSFFGPGDYENTSYLSLRAAEVTLRQLATQNAQMVRASVSVQ